MLFNCKKEHEQWLANAMEDLSSRGADELGLLLVARTADDNVVMYPHNCTLSDLVMMNGFINIYSSTEYLKSAPLQVVMLEIDGDDEEDELEKFFEEE